MLDEAVGLLETLHDLLSAVHSLQNPEGSQRNPARLCRDLHHCQHSHTHGTYWIDPNLGCSSDSIQVTCKNGHTCLKPITPAKLEINVGRVQLNFLQLLSLGAEQSVTVHCFNISVWSPAHGLPPSQRAVRFRGWGGVLLEPTVLEDTCWQKDGQWHQVRFQFRVTDPALLPVTHIANLPEATSVSRYHLEVGPVCFL